MTKTKRSEFNRGFLMAATHPFFQVAWCLLGLYCLLSRKDGWLFFAIVSIIFAAMQAIGRSLLKKEESC